MFRIRRSRGPRTDVCRSIDYSLWLKARQLKCGPAFLHHIPDWSEAMERDEWDPRGRCKSSYCGTRSGYGWRRHDGRHDYQRRESARDNLEYLERLLKTDEEGKGKTAWGRRKSKSEAPEVEKGGVRKTVYSRLELSAAGAVAANMLEGRVRELR